MVTDLVIMGVAPVAIGNALRLHGERAAQAARLDHAEAGRALAEDRAALARDVHDSVGHHLTAIRMQATATRRALHNQAQATDRGQVDAADRALGIIAELSATALREVRALLDSLREPPARPVLEGIEELAGRLSTPHLPISVHRAGPAVPLPLTVARTIYRVAQEARTNAARHSGAGHVKVHLLRDRAVVTIRSPTTATAAPERTGMASGACANACTSTAAPSRRDRDKIADGGWRRSCRSGRSLDRERRGHSRVDRR
ncbi:sensor histidine kinase [Nonomuraea sp. GTA35]|uniref:sensor histidine kinase n=1 Tax=Nonomuraea sp. GTA35 TaxID=1676746 RepID=UPI0035C14564